MMTRKKSFPGYLNTAAIASYVVFCITQAALARDFSQQAPALNIQQVVDRAYNHYKTITDGSNASYISYLAKANTKLYGIAVVTTDGKIFEAGDAEHLFPVESIAKVFTLAHVLKVKGAKTVQNKIGVNATGLPFNSALAIELNHDKLTGSPPPGNPLVNAGAIATASLVDGKSLEEKWNMLLKEASAFAGHSLMLNKDVYDSEMADNQHNLAIAVLLKSYKSLYADPTETIDLYTRECSYDVTAKDLAVMGATLANGGTNPLTHQAVTDAETSARVLAVMATAGLYNTSGEWLYNVGLPAKSGVGGGIVAVVPGKMAIAVYSSPLDAAGNSVRGQLAIQSIAQDLGVNIFKIQMQK
ncbi:glutaminase A [Gluconobacter sp. Dm-74]|uniref:glutaminase A n=1 Tax=Gluconobacter sp. Dm-74 TaxID=2799803 RepID=UPI001B8C9BF4|nr:glutaminase A [Gluconobacter sp. Dm-74]MBS1090929.1 glutaminase A [Gluconobacter sp. Dm-74]